MKISKFVLSVGFFSALGSIGWTQPSIDPLFPHLEKRGVATQLVVDGQPWLIRGGEVANTASSDVAYMKTVWPRLTRLNLNTVLVAVAWDWVEPVEGKFDFTLVDAMLAGARANHQRVVFLWFGSWKNGLSSFVPAWVKADPVRFPRMRLQTGRPVEALSPISTANRDADAKAYVAFMRHLREVDGAQRTVIMIQMQNEVGLLGGLRDRAMPANAAFAEDVPAELLAHLQKNQATLDPDLAKAWSGAGARTSGTWAQVFGAGVVADEVFMAWHYARYMDHLSALGKKEYPLPVFTNTWIVQPEDKGPGDYPSGGPEPLTLDIWRFAAPAIDLNCPDVYLPNFTDWAKRYHRPDNPLFVPESRGDAAGVANAFYAIGQHAALGYSPFGIDNTGRLVTLRPDAGESGPSNLEATPLAKGYAAIAQLTPLILESQAKGMIGAVSLTPELAPQDLVLGNYILHVDLRRNRRNPKQVPALGYAMVFARGPDEFVVAGCDVQVTFSPNDNSGDLVSLAAVEAGEFVGGKWTPNRKLQGDDVLLDYEQASAVAKGQSGSGLRFGPEGPTIQRVVLYRYR
jgi:hypothetical protein